MQDRAFRRSAARASILEAARRLALRDGTTDISLTAVAAEAGFGPSTVFGHFRNKEELLLAIVADDLECLASHMRGVFDHAPAEETGPPLLQPEPSLIERFAAENARAAEAAERHAEVESTPDETQRVVPLLADEPHEAGQTLEVSATDQRRTGETSEAARPRVDAWLERRLRVLERSLTDMERRLGEAERGTVRAISLAEDGMNLFGARLEGAEARHTEALQHFSSRIEESDRRHRGMAAEFRALANDAAGRLDILEAARRTENESILVNTEQPPADETGEAIGEDFGLPPFPIEPLAAEAGPADSTREADGHESEVASAGEPDSFLAAARRAATAAALRADNEYKGSASASVWHRLTQGRVRLKRKHYVIASAAAAVAFLAGASAAFYIGVARGREQIPAPAYTSVSQQRMAVLHVAVPGKVTYRTPLDRLASLANAGNANAELIVGLKYLHGTGIAADPQRAAQWIRRAADQHQLLAEYWMGEMYDRGEGVSADLPQAVQWYTAAAEHGNRKAMHALGVAYAEGRGVQRDFSQAARWFAKAAQLGFVNSQFNLAVLHERGEGVPQSLADAYKWYEIAARQGDEESRARMDALKTQLTAGEVSVADEAARNFRAQELDKRANEAPVLAEIAAKPVQAN